MTAHPCQQCGACCAHFRVAFHWSETDAATPAGTPVAATEVLDPHRVAMRGTYGGAALRCQQLHGEIGTAAHCAIYAQRPSPCRELRAAWEHGQPSPQCDRARAAYGLAPLTPQTWDIA
ncbi:YkgJ family cysteine cluster protein [Lysobacter silvisoli]|uniref:YkgJ family cysteine cluster protein n=1 Tax=Lysobacter silvisoli TaxID=2293254 RepID=A0A371JXY0_9GAMM|nr:YkgJ family cysteine cluster protein [Lysobacter silvisoli]RDZ26511.1 YkgJ family cysteine cluster protein [Lysobacter silvisoli]